MSHLDIRRLDPAAPGFDAAIRAWYGVYLASETYERAYACPWHLAEVVDMVGVPTSFRAFEAWTVHRGGELVAVGGVRRPLADNRHLAQVEVQVLPAARRQGIGTALLAHLERAAREHGRTLTLVEVAFPLGGPDDGAGSPGPDFARAHGYTFALGDVQRRLALPLDEALLDRLAAEAAPHHAAYRLVSFRGPVPDEYVEGYAALAASFMVEAPVGGLEVEAEDSSVTGWREREESNARQGRTMWHTVALDPAGEVVAYTVIAVAEGHRDLCYQWGTLVHPDHRGHRLGLAVKVANHRELQRDGAPAAELVTWNATVNAPMIRVNEQFGFHRTGRLGEMQKHL